MIQYALLIASIVISQSAATRPPPTPVRPVKETVNGVVITDNYRWLEGNNASPSDMGKMTDEIAAWTDAQNAYTRSVLDHLPGRKALEARLRPLMEVGTVTAPHMAGRRYFYSKREGDQNQPLVYVRDGYDGAPRVLLDPAKLDATGLLTISWFRPSQDGKRLAYGSYRAGDENSTLHLLDVDQGKTLPTQISGKVSDMDWMPDGSGFFYRNLANVKDPYSGQVMYHSLQDEDVKDRQVFRQYTKAENEKLATTYGPFGGLSKDGRWLLLGYSTDTRNNDLWCVSVPELLGHPGAPVKKTDIIVGEAAQSSGEAVGDTLFMQTTFEAPNGRVVAVDLKNPSRDRWKVLVPERKDAVLQGVSVAKGILALEYLHNASSQIELFDYDGKTRGRLKLPGIGSAGLSTDVDRTEAFLTFTSFNYPSTIFRVDLAKPDAEPQLWDRPAVPVDPKMVEVEQEWYRSKDGTRVSMFIVHKKGLKRDGSNPTILYGYGGFNISITPTFNAPLFQWFEAGGIYAVANLRGGGEYGKAWHDAGRLEKKQNVFDDYIAAAEYLIAQKYTSSEKLAVYGGSNGGLLTGAFLTQRPDLCAAVVCAVPLLDMVRYQNFLMARYWVPEYGSAEDAAQFAYIYKYSPYHHIKAGTRYPAVLLTAGENDSRVHPLHARKMAAALRAATASDQSQKPILLWVDREAGHGQGKPLNLRVRDTADQRIFLMWQLGMTESSEPAKPGA